MERPALRRYEDLTTVVRARMLIVIKFRKLLVLFRSDP